MNVDDDPNQLDQEEIQGTLLGTPQLMLTDGKPEGNSPIVASANISESDSDQHFSDAIEESDDGSIYSAEDNFPAIPDEGNTSPYQSPYDRWTLSVSVLPNETLLDCSAVHETPTQIVNKTPLRFQQAINQSNGSRIPVPLRFRDASPDEPSSESENTATIIAKSANTERELDKFESEDQLVETSSIPLDPHLEPVEDTKIYNHHVVLPHVLSQSTPNEFEVDDVTKMVTRDSEASQFTITDCGTHRYESDNDNHSQAIIKPVTPSGLDSHPETEIGIDSHCETIDVENTIHENPEEAENAIVVILETIQTVQLDCIQHEEILPPPTIDIHSVACLPSESALTAEDSSIDSPPSIDTCIDVNALKSQSVDEASKIQDEENNDDDYEEIEEELSEKKLSKFGKWKNKLARKSKTKEAASKRAGPQAKTLKIRRKPPKAPGSRPSSATKIKPSSPVTRPTVLGPRRNPVAAEDTGTIRASIKSAAKKMKEDRKPSSSGIAIVARTELSEELKSRSSSHSIRDIFQDPKVSKDIKSPSSPPAECEKTPKQEAPKLNPAHQSKLNSFISKYRIQLKKLNSHEAEMTELQGKSGLLKESLTQLKSQIVGLAGVMPSYLCDIPKISVLTKTSSTACAEADLRTAGSSAYDDLLSENSGLKTENAQLKTSLKLLAKEAKAMKEENSSIKENLNRKKKMMIDQRKEFEDKMALVEVMKEETSRAKKMVEAFRRKNEGMEKTLHESKVKHEEEKSRRAEHEKALVAEINSLKNQMSIDNSKRGIDKQALTKMTEDKENLELQVISLSQTVKELELKTWEHEKELMEKLCEQEKAISQKLGEQEKELRQKLSEQEEEVNKSREMCGKYTELERDFEKLEKELTESRKYCESLVFRIDSNEKEEAAMSKKLIELSEEVTSKMNIIEELSSIRKKEQIRKTGLYKIISDLSSFTGNRIDVEEIQEAAEKKQFELTHPVVKVFEDFEDFLKGKDEEIEKQKRVVADLRALNEEKQSLIEQLYEFVNEKNDSICQRSKSRDSIPDNKDEEKIVERSSNLGPSGGQTSLKDHPDFQILFTKLEVERHTLLRMESQLRRLQDVHAYCGMRRTMQESRIAELETMLAHCLH